MSASKIKSGSDTSLNSNSSWSVIEDSLNSPHPNIQKESPENESDNDGDENLKAGTIGGEDDILVYLNTNAEDRSNASDSEKNNEGFLTFDEYYQVKMSESCNDSMMSADFSKACKDKKKRKAEMISVLSLVASLLTITGLTLIMMMFPSTLNKTDFETVQNNYLETIKTKNFTPEEILKNLTKTSESFKILQKSDVMNNMIDNVKNQTFPETDLIDDNFIVKLTNETKYNDQSNKKQNKEPDTCPIVPTKGRKTKWNSKIDWFNLSNSNNIKSLGDLLSNGNFHRIVCTLLQDICLIKLIYHLNKKFAQHEKPASPKVDTNNETQTAPKSTDKKSVTKIVLPKTITKVEFEKEIQDNINKIIKKYPTLKSYTSKITLMPKTKKISTKIRSFSPIAAVKENGKSECERRFEDLEKQLDYIGMAHRQSIQEIKEKFKEEMSHIHNDNTMKSRTERIHETHKKYIERLKKDRESYLEQLHKFREERQRVMTELCRKKYHEGNVKKDVSVGYNAVLLPGCYDFQEKLKIMRDKQTCRQKNTTNNEENEVDENNNPDLKIKTKRISKKKSKTPSSTSVSIPKIKYSTVLLSSTESTPIVPIQNQPIVECDTDDENERENDFKFKFTMKNKSKVRQADLYSSLFDKKGLEIHKKDLEKWNNSLPPNVPIKIVSKQDTERGFKERIIIKGKF